MQWYHEIQSGLKLLPAIGAMVLWWPYRRTRLLSCVPWIAGGVVLYALLLATMPLLLNAFGRQFFDWPPLKALFTIAIPHLGLILGVCNFTAFALRVWMIMANVGFLLKDHEPQACFTRFLAHQHRYQHRYGIALLIVVGFIYLFFPAQSFFREGH